MSASARQVNGPQRRCGYRRDYQLPGVAYVADEYARKLVLEERLDDIFKIHRDGEVSVCPVLEYAAKRGRHKVTQALVSEGVTVTRAALQSAAKLGGIGIDLLLAGVTGEDSFSLARHDAMHARLFYGDLARAITLLDEGAVPSGECYSALDLGAKRAGKEGWQERAQGVLDFMIQKTPIEHFTRDAIEVILQAGRPIHIERMLQITRQRPEDLVLPAVITRALDSLPILRQLGFRMNDESFVRIATEMCDRAYLCRTNYQPLLDMYVEDSGQTMTATVAGRLFHAILKEYEYYLRRIDGPNEASYTLASETVLPLLNCMDINEHLRVYELIDRWASTANSKIAPSVTAVLKHVVLTTNQIAHQQLTGAGPAP
jgi:hypothetical protein